MLRQPVPRGISAAVPKMRQKGPLGIELAGNAETGHNVIELLFELNESMGTALMLVTHDVELAGRAERVIRLRGGAVVGQ